MESKKINIPNILYYVAYGLIMVVWFMNRVPFIKNGSNILKFGAITIFLVICLIQNSKYKRTSIIKILFLLTIGFLSFYYSKSDVILIFVLMLLSIKDVDIEKLVKYDMICKIIIVTTLFVLNRMGITNEYLTNRNGVIRYSFGFSHPNIFGFVCVNIWIDFIYLCNKRIKAIYIILMIITMLFIDYYADSRSSAILLLLILIVSLVKEDWLSRFLNQKLVKWFVTNSWMIFTGITMIAAYLYYKETSVGIFLNHIFTTRLRHIVEFMKNYNVNLFGNNLRLITTEEALANGVKAAILDNVYIHYLLRFGIVLYMFFYVQFRKLFKYCYKEKNYKLISLLFMFLIYSLVENKFNRFVFVLFIGKLIFEKKLSKSRDGEEEN